MSARHTIPVDQVQRGPALSREALLAALHYDPATGVFTKLQCFQKRYKGKPAGGIHPRSGYSYVCVLGTRYFAHRLAWFYVYGSWPKAFIDHKDLNRSNNAIANLREADGTQSNANRRVQSKSRLLKGVKRSKNRFTAQVRCRGTHFHLGSFLTEREAHEAYVAGAKAHFGEYARAA